MTTRQQYGRPSLADAASGAQQRSEEARTKAAVGNQLLATLQPADLKALRPHFEAVPLELGRLLYKFGDPISHVHFVTSGLVSIVGANRDYRRIEVGMVGFEGLAGLDVVLGSECASSDALVQSEGTALRISAAALTACIAGSRRLHETLLRYAHVSIIQSHQTAIAAGCGKIEERLARGLLMWHDRIQDNELSATHEFLALLLGVRRQGVTVALHALEGRGWIRSTRKTVRIRDRAGLQGKAGGFYGVAEEAYRRAFGPSPASMLRLAPRLSLAPRHRPSPGLA
jgi:CRP-like cAMP-binding protein